MPDKKDKCKECPLKKKCPKKEGGKCINKSKKKDKNK